FGDRCHGSLASGVIKRFGERTAQRVRVARWYDADETPESRQTRKIGAAGTISAHEWKSAGEGLALYQGKPFLTGSKNKNRGRLIKRPKLRVGNKVVVDKPRVIRKHSVKQMSPMDQPNAVQCPNCLSKNIHALPICPLSDEQQGRLKRQSASA